MEKKAPEVEAKEEDLLEVFVLSEAGKPIYCYNRREDTVTLMGVCQALVNFFIDTQSDSLRFITTTSGLRISFANKSPLILVVVTHRLAPFDPQLIITQIHAQIVSILTGKTLKSVFEQRPTFDLRRLLSGSEKLIDTLLDEGLKGKPMGSVVREDQTKEGYLFTGFLSSAVNVIPSQSRSSPIISSISTNAPLSGYQSHSRMRSHANRALIPVLALNPSIRDSVSNTMVSSISAASSSMLFALLFQKTLVPKKAGEDLYPQEFEPSSTKLITVINYNSKVGKLNPMDIQLLETLVIASEGQLSSAESLWLPICLPRVDSGAFIHGHISYLTQASSPVTANEKLCLFLLSADREDFHKCQQIKDTLSERLNKVHLMSHPLTELHVPALQMFWYQSVRPQSMVWRSLPHLEVTQIHKLINYMGLRMLSSNLKTFWMRSDRHGIVLLGWHSPTFQFYGQFDVTITQNEGLNAASTIIKWIKKEEDKITLKDYH